MLTRIVMALGLIRITMDPHMHFQRVGILMNINMYDSLLHKNTKLEYEPSLATAWKSARRHHVGVQAAPGGEVPQRRSVQRRGREVQLRPRARPNTKSPQYGNIRGIKEVKIIDPHTVHLITDKPFPLAPGAGGFLPDHPQEAF